MDIKSIIKLFLPPIILNGVHSIRNRLKKLKESPLHQIHHNTDQIVILGNGPSLKDSILNYEDIIKSKDRIAVNMFASSNYYELIKPNIYVIADPAFFSIPERLKESINTLCLNINEKTNWPLSLVVPLSSKKSIFLKRLEGNSNISIIYYSNQDQYIGNMNRFEAWDHNYLAPPAQTVLNTALYLALYWNYKEIYLLGADSSFFEDLHVDQETNEICSADRHFYKREHVYYDKNLFDKNKGLIRSDRTLHGLIYRYGRMFENYYELKKYSDYKGIKVYNASEYSWINVFERRKLGNCSAN